MEFVHFVFVCFVLITTCLAEEEAEVKEFKNLTVLEPQLTCQKREKQFLIEDEPCEGPEQKRDERQSIPNKNRDSKIVNIRLLPKKVPVNIKQIQPPGLSKPVNVRIDKIPKIIPTKIPVILKTKIVPTPAHTLRMKMMEKEFHNMVHNKGNNLPSNATDPDALNKDNIPNASENISPATDLRSGFNKVDEGFPINSNDTYHLDNPNNVDPDSKKHKTIHEDEGSKPIVEKTKTLSKPEPKPVYFFVDEPEPLPPPIKKRKPGTENGNDENSTKKLKHIPLVKNKKPNKNQRTGNDVENDPDIIQITNGTHIISIKKIPHDRHNVEDEVKETLEDALEERIMDEPLRTNEFENKLSDDSMKVEKDKHGCITITKHNYEEFEEKAPKPLPTVQAAPPTGNQDPWNYLQVPPNFNNPNYENAYENYTPTLLQTPDNANSYVFTPDNSQIYFPNDVNNPAYNTETNQYRTQNTNPETDNVLYQIPRLEALDRIWRAWKDVEIKIRNAHKYEDPILIDIRRNLGDRHDLNKGDVIGKANVLSLPVNGYQNHGNHYPYFKPSYRYSS